MGISYQATAWHMSPSSGQEWESKVKLVHGSIQTAEDGGVGGGGIKGILWCVCVAPGMSGLGGV